MLIRRSRIIIMLNNSSVTNNQEGNNNTAIINSTLEINNDVVVVSAFDMLAKFKNDGDYNGIFNLMKQLGDMAEIQHPFYPHYKYKAMDFGDKTFVDHVPRSNEDAELYPLSYQGTFNISKEDAANFNNFNELLNDAYLNQRDIEVDIVSLKALIAGLEVPTPFLEENIKQGTWVIKPQSLPAPVKLRFLAISNLKEIPIFDCIELGVGSTDNDKQTISVDNRRQENCKLLVSLIISTNELNFEDSTLTLNDTKLKVRIKEGFEQDVEANKQLLHFLTLSKHKDLRIFLKNIETNKNFMSASGFNVDVENMESLEKQLQLFERLYVIEQFYNVLFTIPKVITLEEQDVIDVIENMMQNKTIRKKYNFVTITTSSRECVNNLIDLFEKDKNKYKGIVTIASGPNAGLLLFDAVIPLEKLETTYHELKVEDLAKLKRKYEDMEDGETIKIKLIPGENKEMEEKYFAKI